MPQKRALNLGKINRMARHNTPFEIHVHGEVPLRADVGFEQLQEALKPLWKYAGARSLAAAATRAYEEEPGIVFDAGKHALQMCWTIAGDEDFRQALDEMCMGLNDLAQTGAPIEVTFYDADFDEDDDDDSRISSGLDDEEDEARDDFAMYFVGPTPAAIMQVQRDLLVQDMIGLMERHFDGSELGEVVEAVDRLFTQRFEALSDSMQLGKPPRGMGGPSNGGGNSSHGGGRKPRHLH